MVFSKLSACIKITLGGEGCGKEGVSIKEEAETVTDGYEQCKK
jgi:hypothetical protein